MPLPVSRPINEIHICESTTSIATTPVAMTAVSPVNGYVQRVIIGAAGTTSGTITVAVSINGGSDIFNSTATLAAGTGARAGSVTELALIGAGSTSGVRVNEGDVITMTPSGGTGATIGGAVALVIRM